MKRLRFILPVFAASAFLVLLAGIIVSKTRNAQSSGLYISEVCPHNNSVIYDSVGFYHDYIILTNEGNETIDLAGYSLSDNDDDLKKYVLPDVSLKASESLMLWADVQSAYLGSLGDTFEDEDALYTGFRLSELEMLYLLSPDGHVIDSLRIPQMKRDMALIRSSAKDRGIVGSPKESDEPAFDISVALDPPVLSAGSGRYDEPFKLTIDGNGYRVLYTTDGTSPYQNGITYDGPVTVREKSEEPNVWSAVGPVSVIYDREELPPVPKAFIVRAVAQADDGTFSGEAVATYFVGDDALDPNGDAYILSIVSDPEGLFSDERGIYVPGRVWEMNRQKTQEKEADPKYAPTNYNMKGKHWRRNARVMLFDRDDKCLYDEDVTINIRGGTSRSMLQKSMAIKPLNTGERVFDGLLPQGGDSLDLRTGGEEEAFLTNFRDTLNSAIASNMNVGAQGSVCCQVYLDGEYWGCYNLQDHLNISFVESRYGVPADNVILIKNYESAAELGSDLDRFHELEDFVQNNDLSDPSNYDRFCEMVDIDSLIDYYCAEIFFANYDAYINNVAIWRSREKGSGEYEDCKWRFLLFDTDESDSIRGDWSDRDSFTEGNWMGVNPDEELYFSNLSQNEEFRRRFDERYRQLLEGDLSYERIEPILARFEEDYTDPMVMSMHRYGREDFTEEDYAKNVEVVRDFFRKRADNIGKYLTKFLDNHGGI